jgi:predicted RNA-binding protein with RPS1 domain
MTNGEQAAVVDDQVPGSALPASTDSTCADSPCASLPSQESDGNSPQVTDAPRLQPTCPNGGAESTAGSEAAGPETREATCGGAGEAASSAPSEAVAAPCGSPSEAPLATSNAATEANAAAVSPATIAAETGSPAPEPAAPSEPPRRKIQLNPTATPDQLRPKPTYGEADEPPTANVAAIKGSANETVVAVAEAIVTPSAAPVSLPPKHAPLESSLEAEIDAALAETLKGSPAGAGPAGRAPVPPSEEELQSGTQLKAKVQSVTSENVLCDVGYRAPAIVPLKQFPQGKHPRVGEEFLVIAERFDAESGVIQANLPKATRRAKGNWDELSVGQVVDCYVNKTNKGGLEVTVSNLRGFLPASQVDLGFVQSLESYVGQKFPVQITEVNAAKRNLVVSRRALLIQERKQAAEAFWQNVEVGQQYTGTVKTIKDYGAFVDLGGVDGFLHVGEMSWTRIKHPSDILREGQTIDVVILSLDREKQKIGLGMRQLSQNPWNTAADKYAVGRTVSGRVTRVTDFGAFVELEPGVEGLIHISELDHRRVKRVADVVNVGQEVQAQVLEVAPERQRISLSLKALKEKPEEPKDEDRAPSKGETYERKRKEPLRGGTGSGHSGGLFGNPGDFAR